MPADDHKIALTDSTWAVWRSFLVRGAGFPISLALRMATPESARCCDEVEHADRDVARIRTQLLDTAGAALAAATGDARNELRDFLQRVRAGKAPKAPPSDPAISKLFAELAVAVAATEAALARARACFEGDAHRASMELRAIARSPAFREAVIWQNRNALHGTVDRLLATPEDATDAETRRRELVVASYAQRYATKNESIGYFGPWGYGRFTSGRPIVLEPGPSLLARRHVFFEYWAIARIADALAALPGVRAHLRPRLHPAVRIENLALHHNDGRVIELSASDAELLTACTGERTAKDLPHADRLPAHHAAGFVVWTLEVPTAIAPPEHCLEYERCVRSQLKQIDDPEVRTRASLAFESLCSALAAVTAAQGDPDALDRAIDALETRFHDFTNADVTRNHGKTYAGRNIFFEDCVRDVKLEFGPAVLDVLARPLSLLLDSARWFTFEVAKRFRAIFDAAYDELVAETASSGTASAMIDYGRFWRAIGPRIFTMGPHWNDPVVDEVVALLHARWHEILGLANVAPGQRRVELSAAELAPHVARAFDAPNPGWPNARYHSPDVLIVAPRGKASFDTDDIHFVLGEIHTGVNTLVRAINHEMHPDVAEIMENVTRDIEIVRVARPEAKDSTISPRLGHISFSARDVHLETGATPSFRSRDEKVRIADLVVERRDGHLVIRTRDGARAFDVIAFYEEHLRFKSGIRFSVVPPFGKTETKLHTPRITIDRFILAHERWRFAPTELAFAREKSAFDRFRGARAWAHANDLPRFVFAKIPEEKKPIYIDFESPTLVELLAKQARAGSAVSISEMLPGVDDAWLTDAAGNTYTAELRIAALDERSFCV